MQKSEYLKNPVQHVDITQFDASPLIHAYRGMAFQARNLARAADIWQQMVEDKECTIILTLAGSLVSAGLKKIIVDLLKNRLVDVIVSTGANIVDQDFFEALGFKHWQGSPFVDDQNMRELGIDRIYDTYIDEDQLRICDDTIAQIADQLEPRAWSSREFIHAMGQYLIEKDLGEDSIVRTAAELNIPIFVPAFSDCSAGFGLVYHQEKNPDQHVSIDSVRDFRELTQIKIAAAETGLVMLAGGVPKNFTQDVVVAADILGKEVSMHKYAIQLTVADERDGALSGSTLKEACSWGKVDTVHEQMVFSELTLTLPLLASYVYHQHAWENRSFKSWNTLFQKKLARV
ncbi:deoxyhypusine synthase [bacterium (Candidatus Blackallbacteria) CG17_big_fil_post_rev_8_21_14_2_50_48_46]|uniref:Deoxyhypusine synthase-like protein n=1 Tax=bacterium (Candidatus Blackallbacteria) CG17_big_fil_post_rev_8_21_14_2_50_48_46 TaxID=2014261 RepID=A0A2M7G3C1_9BACT|nr:MAG: deoxyhypusine synthase [bacterium (Candidatus Blackallbacteria) CG18_big_fil_WC_8_21_14_2_50_49_26]PIW16330.1 MAG: deoxyhypusine synthase [bacterium (Candidatus Blackallbacteria) CG17_big_fil_post_rev_8_21_14_2_50_48_46]PIW45344.1 MAG: deoxyhypusine synthase [bacterium (Candidatus Blackallbacteria) CG13_big_fil_rev_8_21_14_2_50_49_14]